MRKGRWHDKVVHQEYWDNGIKLDYKEAESEDWVAIRMWKKSPKSEVLHFDGGGCGNRKEGKNFIGFICFVKQKEKSKRERRVKT